MPSNPKYTTEQIIDALRAKKGLIYLAAGLLGCAPSTIYRKADHVKAVEDAIKDARGILVDHAEEKLSAAVDAGEPWAVSMVLKTLGKDRGYTERQEVTGKDGGAIAVDLNLKALTDEELVRFEQLTRKATDPS